MKYALIAFLLFNLYLTIRAVLVFKLREKMLKLIYNGYGDVILKRRLLDKVSFEDMMNKIFRRVRLESFYSKEEIKILKSV